MSALANFARLLAVAGLFSAPALWAQQQTTIAAPRHRVSDGFYENLGISFGGTFGAGRGYFFSGGAAPPPLGGGGFSAAGPLGNHGFFRVFGEQGSSRGFSTVAPSVTVMNGGQAAIQDVTVRPFVIGTIPVVGSFGPIGAPPQFNMLAPQYVPASTSVLDERLHRLRQAQNLQGASAAAPAGPQNLPPADLKPAAAYDDPARTRLADAARSTAGQAAESVAAIRAQQARDNAARQGNIEDLLRRGRAAQSAGNAGLARYYFQLAERKSSGPLRETARQALQSLDEN